MGADGVFQRRARILHVLLALMVGLYVGRLYLLQVIRGEKYREGSQANSEKRVRLEAPRGLIYDRKGRLLVGNRRAYDLVLDRERVREPEKVAAWVSEVTGESPEQVLARIQAKPAKNEPSHRPLVLARDLTFSQVAWVEARREDVVGVSIETTILREYPNGALAAHVLGYVGEIDQAELDDPQFAHHEPRDQVGKVGIERSYDDVLSGIPGTRRVVVDNVGRSISTGILEEPDPGANVYLTLDLDVQQACEDGLAGYRGACVMLDVRTGGVLAIASAPTYDPNTFVGGISTVRWNDYRNDPHKPLQFRAIAGEYPPGSVWKALVSAAALQSGKHSPSTTITCNGAISMWGRVRHCHKEEGHGTIGMREALIKSCNVYYYIAGRDMGAEPMWSLARDVGFGETTGIDVPGEKSGIMPDEDWKRRNMKRADDKRWYPGDTVNLSIGQGFCLVTPMQVAQFGMSIANDGDIVKPHVFDRAVEPGTNVLVKGFAPETTGHVPFTSRTLDWLHPTLEQVVETGTATRAKVKGFKVAGKTGTAQPSSGEAPKGTPRELRAERYQEHAWFMGYAPADAPEVAFAIVLEHSGLHGGEGAAPIASRILTAYFSDRMTVAGQ